MNGSQEIEQTRHIMIVGGGTAGWLTAAILEKASGGAYTISVVESPEVPSIGVGEATIPSLTKILQDLGLDEREFMVRTNATFKQAILFENWMKPGPNGKPHRYYHTFEKFQGLESNRVAALKRTAALFTASPDPNLLANWLTRQRAGVAGSYATETGIQSGLCERRLAPKTDGCADYQGLANYAYHLDAEAFGGFLTSQYLKRGVKRILAHVTGAEVGKEGITALNTRDGQRLTADFFVDCTGFGSHLLGKALGVAFRDYSDYLLCDRAVAIRVPHAQGTKIPPYTQSTAVEAGWIWDINLAHRKGAGYVFSSAFLSEDEASHRLRSSLGDQAANLDPRIVRFQPGRRDQMWLGNCVGIGLSAGFLEPLESTGIYLIEKAAALLAELIPGHFGGANPEVNFNSKMNCLYDEIRDFIVLHYYISNRDDTRFWKEVRTPERAPASLKEKLAVWDLRPPGVHDTTDNWQCFWYPSYRAVLYGMDRTPKVFGAEHDLAAAEKQLGFVQWTLDHVADRLPVHDDFIKHLHGQKLDGRDGAEQSSDGLRPDLSFTRLTKAEEPLWISNGVRRPNEQEINHEFSASVPREPWAPVSDDNIQRWFPVEAAGNWGREIFVLPLPPEISVPLLALGAELSPKNGSAVTLNTIQAKTVRSAGLALARLYADDRVTVRSLGIATNQPDLVTTTRERNGLHLGLHVDSWMRGQINNRATADNRICVNIGPERRWLLVLPYSFSQVASVLKSQGLIDVSMGATELARIAMRLWPDLSVIRIPIEPGEAYIAPTENVIHDASTVNKCHWDIIATYLGRFRPQA
jgi:tryptophan halogenase